MATVADLLVKISADSSGLRKELNAAKRQIKETFGTEAMKLSQKAANSLKYIAIGMAGIVTASVVMSAKMDMTKRAFETLTGSVQKAQEHLDALEKFGATTPFEFAGLTEASKKMQAYGFGVDAVIPVLTVLGDASMAVGLGQEGIDRVTLAIGQMNAKGKLTAEEMRQLAETGLPVWDILASKLGTTTAKAMELSKKGAISAKEGITAILTGLEDRFGGMMEKVAGEIPQSFSNMKDSVGSIMRTLGGDITEAFDLKTKFKNAADWMGDFAAVAKQTGIKEAFEQMVPESVKTAIIGISGAVVGIAVPAFLMLGEAVIAATWPLLASAAVISFVAVAIYKNWFGIGWFFETLWTGIVNIFSWAKDLIVSICEKIGAMATWVGNKISAIKAFLGMKTEVAETNKEIVKTTKSVKSLKDILAEMLKDSGKIDDDGAKAKAKAAKAAEAAAKKQQQKYKRLVEEAKAASDRIEEEWIRLTKTQMDVLDKWFRDEITTLSKSKSVNENYQRDITRLNETYSEKRRQILHDEAKDRQETFKTISDGWASMQKDLTLGGLKGSAADLFSMDTGALDQVKGIFDYFDDISARYTSATDAQKKNILDSLNAMGIQYKLTTEDMLDFTVEKEQASNEKWKQLQDDKLEYYKQCKNIQSDIDEAFRQGSFARLQTFLTEENAISLASFNAQQAYMNLYYETWLEKHKSISQQITEILGSTQDSFKTLFSDILEGTVTFGEAFQSFFESLWTNIVNSFAEKWSASITNTIMDSLGLFGGGKDDDGTKTWATKTAAMLAYYAAEKAAHTASTLAQAVTTKAAMAAQAALAATALAVSTAASVAAAATTAAAWAPAAAAVSLASYGANSEPAMAGITATHALSQSLSLVPLAEGGYVTGPTLAMIGEGQYKESVVQDSNIAYKKIASGINRQSGDQDTVRPVNININTNDAKSFAEWLEDGGGRELEKYLTRRGRSFATVGGF